MKKIIGWIIAFFVLVLAGVICIQFYSYLFSRNVRGVIVGVKRVTQAQVILGGDKPIPPEQSFSFAVAIKEQNGEIVTASSEDRQWDVVKEGQCAEAKYYPYPPWNLDKAGTYHGARLLKLSECSPLLSQ